jgi:hypothetical protein
VTIVRSGLDAYVLSAYPNANYAAATRLRLDSTEAESFVFFKSPVPVNGSYTVTSAVLRFRTAVALGGSVTVSAQRVAASYKTRLLTWNNKPGVVGSVVSQTISGPTTDTWWELDVTAHVQAIANGSPNYGWKLTTTSTSLLRLFSLNAAQYKPTLVVEYTDKPEKPGMLTPYGGLAVGIPKPVVRFSYSDPGGDDGLDAVQVQIDAGNNFVSGIDFDSGWVTAATPELDLSATAYGGLSDGATTYWRVRVRDEAGGISDWSDVASFSRDDKGTLTITNPAAPASNYVDEFTPPIAWTFTGETQKAFRVRVGLASKPGVWRYDSGKIVSASTSHTLPFRYNGRRILMDDHNYVVEVRVWDTKDRVGVPYVQAQRTFAMNYDATVTAVTSLTATQPTIAPWVTLQWQRGTMPDEWIIIRDGEVIEREDVAADLFVSGTTYQFIDRTARGFVAHTYKVRAVVTHKTASSSPTVTITPVCKGFWLSNENGSLQVLLHGTDIENMAYGEDAATHVAIGADSATRIVAGMRGIEGTFVGTIYSTENPTRTWDAHKQDLLQMKASPSTTYRAAFGDENIPVLLGEVSVSPAKDATPGQYSLRASVAFWQNGELPFEAEL